jgi:hypothetical protein
LSALQLLVLDMRLLVQLHLLLRKTHFTAVRTLVVHDLHCRTTLGGVPRHLKKRNTHAIKRKSRWTLI